MNGSGAKIQAWLTPALLAVGLAVLLFILAAVKDVRSEVKTVDTKLDTALLQLQKHETVLGMHGFLTRPSAKPQPWNGQ